MLNQGIVEVGVATGSLPRAPASAVKGRQADGIAEVGQGRLRASPYLAVRGLLCEHHEGVLVLRGRVSSFYQKQLAQEAVRNIRGVGLILNVVEVVAPGGS